MRRSLHVFIAIATLAATPSDDAKILHALDWLTFGPRPGDMEQVRAIGLKKWIDQQLNPKKIAENPVLVEKLQPLDSLFMSTAELVRNYPTPQMIRRLAEGNGAYPTDPVKRRLIEMQVDDYRMRNDNDKDAPVRDVATFLTPRQRQTLQSGTKEEKLQVLSAFTCLELDEALAVTPKKGRDQLYAMALPDLRRHIRKTFGSYKVIEQDLLDAKLYRASYSNRQLAEVLGDFWFNHFNVYQQKGDDRFMVTAYERDAIRPHILGKFKDLLQATAESPAMLIYLDNFQSVGEGIGAPPKRRRNESKAGAAKKGGLNENYGRELLELHTLGVDGGYTQKDVTEVARCFTGWTVWKPNEGGGFEFDKSKHDNGDKVVLDVRIPRGGGMQDGLKVLDILVRHPSTARFISRKLAVRFVSDNPPAALIDRMAKTFTKSGGAIREVMTSMLESDEFWSEKTYRTKMKSPLEMVASAVRALGVDVDYTDALAAKIAEVGQPLYRKQEPTGYFDSSEEWLNTASLLARMNFGIALAGNRIAGVKALDPKLLEQLASLQPAGLSLGGPAFQRK